MINQFRLYQRSGVYYAEDTTTGKQTSLRTKDKADARAPALAVSTASFRSFR